MAAYNFTTSAGTIIAIDSLGPTDYALPPTLPITPGSGGSPFVPDYLQDGNGQTNPVNGARAGIRLPNPAPVGTVTVAAVVQWQNPNIE